MKDANLPLQIPVTLELPRKFVVVDTETLGLRPDSAIIEIGAVACEADGRTVRIVGEFHSKIYAPPQLHSGAFSVTPETLRFHLDLRKIPYRIEELSEEQQLERLLASLKAEGYVTSPRDSSYLFEQWASRATTSGDAWFANGTDFDFPILEHFLFRVSPSSEFPWKYNAKRDLRTLLRMHSPYYKMGNPHNALQDARNEAKAIADIFRLQFIPTA